MATTKVVAIFASIYIHQKTKRDFVVDPELNSSDISSLHLMLTTRYTGQRQPLLIVNGFRFLNCLSFRFLFVFMPS